MMESEKDRCRDQSGADGVERDDSREPRIEEKEIGGRKKGLEPTRYGDWEMNGRCIDF